MLGSNNTKAVIFDFDGTIIDTETPDYVSWCEVFEAYGCDLPFDIWADSIGRAVAAFDIYDFLKQASGKDVDKNTVGRARFHRYLELVAEEPIRPGVQGYLGDASRLGLRLGVSSSGSSNWVEGHLRQRQIYDHFSAISTIDHVRNGKPAPDLFLRTARMMGVEPASVIAIEDSPNGVAAARNAGMFTVAVPNPTTRTLDFGNAHVRLESLDEMSLEALLALATAA
ncbi:MAG: HAD-IA family hydrolase [Caldilineales bacterium]|nr:HAD-IA family hydrolase [Caldilineales bacterium]